MTGTACIVCKIVNVIVGLAALDWGLVGVFGVDPLASLVGGTSALGRIVYGVIGVAGILKLLSLVKCCPCQKGSAGCSTAT